jgi:Zn-dependent protease
VNPESTDIEVRSCSCGAELPSGILACPSCHRLVHSEKLALLAEAAARATQQGDLSAALAEWRSALELLPSDSRQWQVISQTIAELSERVSTSSDPPPLPSTNTAGSNTTKKTGRMAGLGVLGAILLKFKFIIVFILTKGKILFLGLTKSSTVLSMFLSMGVYWTVYGWKFAVGLVMMIYVHEMGHVVMLSRYGIKATAPMFLPGFGAVIRLKQYPSTPKENARVGLAGPIWGLGAAAAAYAVFLVSHAPFWAAMAKVGAWLNLFNLLPVWQLDGSRGLASLTRTQRGIVLLSVIGMWALTHESLLAMIAVVTLFRCASEKGADQPDQRGMLEFVFLVIALALMCMIPVAL